MCGYVHKAVFIMCNHTHSGLMVSTSEVYVNALLSCYVPYIIIEAVIFKGSILFSRICSH